MGICLEFVENYVRIHLEFLRDVWLSLGDSDLAFFGEFFWNSIGTLWEFFGEFNQNLLESSGISLRMYGWGLLLGNCLGILFDFFGNSL